MPAAAIRCLHGSTERQSEHWKHSRCQGVESAVREVIAVKAWTHSGSQRRQDPAEATVSEYAWMTVPGIFTPQRLPKQGIMFSTFTKDFTK